MSLETILSVFCGSGAKVQRAWGIRLEDKLFSRLIKRKFKIDHSLTSFTLRAFLLFCLHTCFRFRYRRRRRVNKISRSHYKFPMSFLSSIVHFVCWTSKQKPGLFLQSTLSSSINWDRLECQFNVNGGEIAESVRMPVSESADPSYNFNRVLKAVFVHP